MSHPIGKNNSLWIITEAQINKNMENQEKESTQPPQPIPKKSQASAILFSAIMCGLITSVLIAIPSPFNIPAAIALGGPLSASIFGIIKRSRK